MALKQKMQIDNTRVFLEYWKISYVTLDVDNSLADVTLKCFISQEARQDGANPFGEQKTVRLGAALLGRLVTCPEEMSFRDFVIQQTYEQLKESAALEVQKPEIEQQSDLAFFNESVDC